MSQSLQLAQDQLLELLLQLKRAGPAAARQILNSQPQIAYALITLMVSMNAISVEAFQKALAEYTASQANSSTPQPLASSSSRPTPPIAPASSIPPHMQAAQTQYRVGTPPSSSSSAMLTPPPSSLTPTNAYGAQGYGQGAGNWGPSSSSLPPSSSGVASGSSYGSYDAGVGSYSSSGYSGFQQQQQQTTTTTSTASQPQVNLLSSLNPAVLTSIPEEQKAMVVHVLSLTQEQINRLPPQDRTSILQLRATLGL